jgi:hypothetical protein
LGRHPGLAWSEMAEARKDKLCGKGEPRELGHLSGILQNPPFRLQRGNGMHVATDPNRGRSGRPFVPPDKRTATTAPFAMPSKLEVSSVIDRRDSDEASSVPAKTSKYPWPTVCKTAPAAVMRRRIARVIGRAARGLYPGEASAASERHG